MLRRDGAAQAERVDVGAAFVAIGHEPNTDLFRGQIDTTPGGYLDMSQSGRSARTSKPGVFACGDVADPTYRQAITSAASGAMAALDAERWLSEEGA
jgi:thioredoxin reductase (NADPH)